MSGEFLPDYSQMPWNGRYRPLFKLFASERWRYVRKDGYRNGFKFPSCRWEGIFIARDIADRLDTPALERGLTVNELSNKLLSIIAMDGLVGAILDEG